MPSKSKKQNTETTEIMQPNPVQRMDPEEDDFIEGVNDQDENIRAQLPSQDHCSWLVNIIQIHAKKIAQKILADHEKTSFLQLKQEINDLKQANGKMKAKLDEYQTEINKLKWSRDGINKDLAKKNKEVDNLRDHIDSVDQKQREKRVCIVGIAEEPDEDLIKKVVKMAKTKMGLKKIKEENVVQIYRSGKKKSSRTRNIIVQFESKLVRDSFYNARKKLHGANDDYKNTYINEDLTEFRLKLLFDARTFVKKKRLRGAWTQNGNVMVLTDHGGPRPVYTHRDLRTTCGVDIYDEGSTDNLRDDIGTISEFSY